MSPTRGNMELSRCTSRNPPDSPGAAGNPHKRTMRKTASHLSPRKDQGEFLLLSMMVVVRLGLKPAQQEHLSKCGMNFVSTSRHVWGWRSCFTFG